MTGVENGEVRWRSPLPPLSPHRPDAGHFTTSPIDEPAGPLPRHGPAALFLLAALLTVGLAVGDYLTGPEVKFTLLYLAPAGLATWFVGFGAGAAISALGAVLCVTANVLERTQPLPAPILLWNFTVQLGTLLLTSLLLAIVQRKLESEQHAARTDHLTQLPNRRAFIEMAVVELERSRRTGRPLTVAYLDVDDFKGVNDLWGHATGDTLLVTLASTLRATTRALDVLGRLGGDEFGLLLVDTDGPTADSLLERLRSTLALAMEGCGLQATFSIGAATFAAPARSVDEMLARADGLMYEAKRAGKDRVRLAVEPQGAPEQSAVFDHQI